MKTFFLKNCVFEISKLRFLNPRLLNSYSLLTINHTSIQLVKKATTDRFVTTLGIRCYFQYEISPLFSTIFSKNVDGRPRKYATVISNLCFTKSSLIYDLSKQ